VFGISLEVSKGMQLQHLVEIGSGLLESRSLAENLPSLSQRFGFVTSTTCISSRTCR
jgi:hypothetical protein